jgi:hypothetical protein
VTDVPKPVADAVAAVHLTDEAAERMRIVEDLANSEPQQRLVRVGLPLLRPDSSWPRRWLPV